MKHLSPFIATHKSSTRKRGQALVEFALVLPVLLLFIMGTIDFGRALFTYAQASSQLRQALRLAAVVGYDAAPTPPYRDCDRMRSTAQSVFFANSIDVNIMYLRVYSLAPDDRAWDDYTHSFDETKAVSCNTPGTSGPDDLLNGDVLRIRETVTIGMITPLFPQTLIFTLQGQRTVIRGVTLASVMYCGDLVCQPDNGEDSTTCAGDCSSTPGENTPTINSVDPCGVAITTPHTITVDASDPDPGDGPGLLHVTVLINGTDTYTLSSSGGTTYTLTPPWDPGVTGNYTFIYTVADNSTPQHTFQRNCSVTVTATGTANTYPVIDQIVPDTASPSMPTTIKVYAHDAETGPGLLNVVVTVSDGTLNPVSGVAAWTCTGSPPDCSYQIVWTTPGSGSPLISVDVADTGTPTPLHTSGSHSVTIDAACGGNCPPGPVVVTSPAGGSTVSGSVPIEISAPDGETAPQSMLVTVSIDGTLVGSATWKGSGYGYTYVYTWYTGATPNGSHDITATAQDSGPGPKSATSVAVNVTVNNAANAPPVIDGITTDAGLTVNHDTLRQIRVTAHDAPGETPVGGLNVTVTVTGGTLNPVSGVAAWNAGLGAYVIGWTVPALGPVTITATVTDTGIPAVPISSSVTATVVVPTSMHVSALAITYTWLGGNNNWAGIITITVVDNLGVPVPGVTVTGNWLVGSLTGRSSCAAPTNASGQCTIQIGGIQWNKSLTFTMLASTPYAAGTITGGTLTYVAGDNVVNTVTWGPPTVPYP